MGQLDEMEAKLDWCVAALKHLLTAEVDGVPTWDAEELLDDDEDQADVEAELIARLRNSKLPPPCPHNQQVLVNGMVCCARCGEALNRSGVRGRDANSPVPAAGHEESLSHISSNNTRY